MVVPLLAGSDDHVAQLAALGLRLEYFHDALRAGEEARRLVTENDPISAAGTVDYFRRVRVLRDRLITEVKWKRADLDGLPLVINPQRTMAIGVLLGDHETGWVGPYHPRSKRPVGQKKVKLAAQNQQLTLIPTPVKPDEIDIESADLTKVRTWFLLTYRRVKADKITISSELSEPSDTGLDSYVEHWIHRIPFPDLTFEGVTPYQDEAGQNRSGYEVAVDEK